MPKTIRTTLKLWDNGKEISKPFDVPFDRVIHQLKSQGAGDEVIERVSEALDKAFSGVKDAIELTEAIITLAELEAGAAAGGPVGELIIAVIGVAYALAEGIVAIVERVREENGTIVLFINALPHNVSIGIDRADREATLVDENLKEKHWPGTPIKLAAPNSSAIHGAVFRLLPHGGRSRMKAKIDCVIKPPAREVIELQMINRVAAAKSTYTVEGFGISGLPKTKEAGGVTGHSSIDMVAGEPGKALLRVKLGHPEDYRKDQVTAILSQ